MNPRTPPLFLTAGLVLFAAGFVAAAAPPYVVVVDRSPAGFAYAPAAEALAKLREPSLIIGLDEAGGLDEVFERIRAVEGGPQFVAFVVPPSRIEDNFVGEVFERATRLDDSPDLDFAYGFITGATPDDALAMVNNTARAESDRASIPKKFVGIGHTFREADLGMFALQEQADLKAYGFESEAINPIDDSAEWKSHAAAEMRKLDGASLVYFAGHGMGEVCCGIDADLFEGFTLDRAVIVNGACHSAVCSVRHDISPQTMGIITVPIPAERCICLRLIHAGAIAQLGSTASSSWMNVGPAIEGFFNEGKTVGEALRDRLNDHMASEHVRDVKVIPFKDGEPSPQFLGPAKDPAYVQSIARVVLIGDPAYRPYPGQRAVVRGAIVPERPHPMGPPPAANRALAGPGVPDLSGSTIPDLVARLKQPPDAGFAALNETIRRGDPAVQPLIDAMATSSSWQLPKALGAIGDERAIDPLIAALEKNRTRPFMDVVVESLELITGEKYGDNAAAWKKWRENDAHGAK